MTHSPAQLPITNAPVKRNRRIMIFDVETTGLIPKLDPITKKRLPLENMPHIIQLSFIIFNVYEYVIEKKYNAYIKLDNLDLIKEEITQLTGITKEKCENGIDIKIALQDFYEEFVNSDYIIAHNISFDKQMIMIEIERNYMNIENNIPLIHLFDPHFCKEKGIELYCTMMSSINVCNILIESKNKKLYKKFPKLSELYFVLFQSNPENLHNAMVDTLVCLRCFIKLRMHKDIHNMKYNNMLESVMKMV